MIFTMLDPTRLELSLDLKWNYEEKIIKNILNKIDKIVLKIFIFIKIFLRCYLRIGLSRYCLFIERKIERDEKYKAIIYDIDGTLLDTLKNEYVPPYENY